MPGSTPTSPAPARRAALVGLALLAGALAARALDPPGLPREARLELTSLLWAGLALAFALRCELAGRATPPGWRSAGLVCGGLAVGLELPHLVEWFARLDPLGREPGLDPQAHPGLVVVGVVLAGVGPLLALLRPRRPFLCGLLGVTLVGLGVPPLIDGARVGSAGPTDLAPGPGPQLLGGLLLALGAAAAGLAWRNDARTPTGPRRSALLVGAAGMVCALLGSELVRAFERQRAALRVDRNAAWLKLELEGDLAACLRRLVVLDQLLRAHGPTDELPAEIETSLRLEPGYRALARLDEGGQPVWIVPAGGPLPPRVGLEPALAEALAGRPAVQLDRSPRGLETGTVWVVANDPRDGFLAGLLDTPRVLSDALEGQRERGFQLLLRLDDLPLLDAAPPAPGRDPWRRAWSTRLGGVTWQVEVWPDAPLQAELRTRLPDAVLGAGLLLAGAFALLFRLTQRERHSRLELEQASARLAEEVAERVQAEAALERSNRDLEEFAAVAAHDLRAPLRAVRGLADWIAEDLGEERRGETQDNLRLLGERVARMERLLDGLFEYARAGARGEVERVDVSGLVAEIRQLLEPPPGVAIVADPGLPVFTAARVPLLQVLLNLIGNALAHHDRAQGRIEVTARREERFWRFAVEDDGPGIPPQHHRRVFQLFTTLRPGARDGSGMGLALVRRTVGRQGGSVDLVSPVSSGRGTRVSFTWPCQPRRAESQDG